MFRAPVGNIQERKLPDAGTMKARVVAVLDLGTHIDPKFLDDKGRPQKRHIVQIQWELDQMMTFNEVEQPMMATARYTLSSHKKSNLRRDLEGLYGKVFSDRDLEASGGFDLEKILGRPCMLNLVHSEDGQYANIKGITPPLKGAAGTTADQHYPSRLFVLDKPDPDVWATLSQKTRDYIRDSEEVKAGTVELPEDPERT